MEFIAEDRHLNVFHHYKGKPELEDNITRALMILMSKPPGADVFCRQFLQALRAPSVVGQIDSDKVEGYRRAIESCLIDAESVAVDMQVNSPAEADSEREASAEHPYVIGLALTPRQKLVQGGEAKRRSRADAELRFEIGGSDEGLPKEVIITVETKLWGSAWEGQVESHTKHLKPEGADVVVHLQWSELYEHLQGRPSYLNSELLVQDFDELIARFPRLTGWIGIGPGDLHFDGRAGHRVQVKVEQLANQLVQRSRGHGEPEPQWGADFTIRPKDASKSAGNLGVACWTSGELCVKLVVGAKSKGETSSWLRLLEEGGEAQLGKVIRSIGDLREKAARRFPGLRVELRSSYRLRRVQFMRHYGVVYEELGTDTDIGSVFRETLGEAKKIQAKGRALTPQDFHEIRDALRQEHQDRFEAEFAEELERPEKASNWWQSAVLDIWTLIPEADLTGVRPKDLQVEYVHEVLEAGHEILRAVSL